jgi:hypothetical protein
MPKRIGSWIWLVVAVLVGAVVLSQNSPGVYSAVGALAIFAFVNFLLFEGFTLTSERYQAFRRRVSIRIKNVWLAYFDPDGVEV